MSLGYRAQVLVRRAQVMYLVVYPEVEARVAQYRRTCTHKGGRGTLTTRSGLLGDEEQDKRTWFSHQNALTINTPPSNSILIYYSIP